VRQRVAVAVAITLISAAVGVWFASTLRTRDAEIAALPEVRGTIALAGIQQPVRIDRDRHGVPHVDAATRSDAFFALGFCQGQDRLGQLLWLRRQARGTAAEQVGARALDADRAARVIDFRGLAERQWPHLPRAAQRALESFAAGVNARIARVEQGEAAPPIELRGEAIEPWRPQDSLALFKLFAWGLGSSVDASLALNELVEALGASEAGRFFPARGAAPTEPPGRTTASAASWFTHGLRDLRSAWGLDGHGVGSAAFVVGGHHTESGAPVLVADSHFAPTAPAALYLAHLRGPDLDVAGATLPGVPIFWWGRNPHLAWAAVNAGIVATDLYTETVREQGREYHDGRRWRPVEERQEELRVRGGVDATLAVRRTGRGPLLPLDRADGEAVSVSWTGARVEGASGIGSLLAVADARDGADVRKALRRHHEPAIALVWAEASGAAGLQVAGWIPRRSLAPQLLPLPGRARWYDWQDSVPFDELPAAKLEDGEGFLIAADQAFQLRSTEEPIDSTWRSGVREARLHELLAQQTRGKSDLRQLASLQMDVTLDRSRELIDVALSLLGDRRQPAESGELVRLLRGWDGRATSDSVGATAYHFFLDSLSDALFRERIGPERFDRYEALPALDLEALVLGVLRDAAAGGGGDSWSDPEAVRDAVARSLRASWLGLSFRRGGDPRHWEWGSVHTLRFRRGDGARTGLGPFPYPGSPHSVLAAAYSPADPFEVTVAATARFAVDAASLDIALTALAPGASEHPSDPGFDQGVAGWLEGRHSLLATRRLEIEDLSVARLVLEPVR